MADELIGGELRYQESRKYGLWNRLLKRFDLIPSQSYKGWLDGVVVPVTNADELVAMYRMVQGTANSDGVAVQVPDGKRWTIHYFSLRAASTGTWAKVDIVDRDGTEYLFHGFESLADAWVVGPSEVGNLVLEAGWSLSADGAGTDQRTINVYVKEEDVFT